MSKIDIFNIEESIQEHMNESNEEDLRSVAEHFKTGQFETVVEKTKAFRTEHEVNDALSTLFTLLNATSFAQIWDHQQAKELLNDLYDQVYVLKIRICGIDTSLLD
ncbi:hypothetical protein [Gracilibacillus kekensis]|uniref:hypothetical protein n=1 Tax=Gracilibacillus kekensis TaxID=1027249 RepID=UPI0009333C18|nr:hypothetical protein [Gracilibacillus kekensis]